MNSPLVSVASGKAMLHVDDGGDPGHGRTPVVCLHAAVADARMWQPQLDALRPRRRVIAYDRRGFGRTQVEPESFSSVDDLVAVLDAAGLKSAVLMGCSQGGRIAIDAALAHPDRVSGLVLVACGVSGAPQPTHFSPPTQAKIDALAAAQARDDRGTVNQLHAQLWLDGPEESAGRVKGAVRELFLSMNEIALRAPSTPDELLPLPAYPRLQELHLPVKVVWGSLDFEYIRARMRLLVERIAGAKALVIDGTAHFPNLEQPSLFNAGVERFLDGL